MGETWQDWKDKAVVSKGTFYNRKKQGMDAKTAATMKKSKDKYDWLKWKGVAEERGIKKATFIDRRKKGMSAKDAATTPFKRGDKYSWREWEPVATENDISRITFVHRRKKGMDPETAATKPLVKKQPRKEILHAVYYNHNCVYLGTKEEVERILNTKYELNEHDLYRVDDKTIVFEVES